MKHIISTKSLGSTYIDLAWENRIRITNVPMTDKKTCTTDSTLEMMHKFMDSYINKSHPIIFTSGFAVISFLTLLEKINFNLHQFSFKVFCIAPKTLELVQFHLPNTEVIAVSKNASELADKIKGYNFPEVSFFCGNRRRNELTDTLNNSSTKVQEYIIYETRLTPKRIENYYDGVMFFSPSAVESFLKVNTVDHNKQYFAIGSTTADSFNRNTNGSAITPDTPSASKMIEMISNYYNTSKAFKENEE